MVLFAGLGIVLAAGACSGNRASQSSPDAPAVLEVQNDGTMDMNIFVYARGGNRNRLGTAIAHRTSHFTIPQRLMFGLTAMQFQADPIGAGARPISQEITVVPGDTVVMHIPPGN
jgi:hypothetical protein